MIAVGIDISKAKSTVAVIDSDGTVLASPFVDILSHRYIGRKDWHVRGRDLMEPT